MSQNVIEHLRELSVNQLFKTNSFSSCWNTWKPVINSVSMSRTPRQILDIGDHLSEIFATTKTSERSQSAVSGGGATWESLVCWYLNLCLIGRRTIVIKHNKQLVPTPVSDAITVNYNNFISNTESDLIAITFPNKVEYNMNKDDINIVDENGIPIPTIKGRKYNSNGILNGLSHRDFSELEIHIIQCKTNWNDNAQIPMLWDMIYSARDFRSNITVGRNGYSIHDTSRFTYSFVTVPTSRMGGIKPNATCVKRVTHISGGNYWGKQTVSNVASSIKELLARNLYTGHTVSPLTTISKEISKLNSDYNYFKL